MHACVCVCMHAYGSQRLIDSGFLLQLQSVLHFEIWNPELGGLPKLSGNRAPVICFYLPNVGWHYNHTLSCLAYM